MPRKKAAAKQMATDAGEGNGDSERVQQDQQPKERASTDPRTLPPAPRPPIHINAYSLTELKNACDDSLKKLLSQPQFFQQQHFHADIRLALGYLSVLVAGATGLYGWKVEFEKSKTAVRIGVVIYFVLIALQTIYVVFWQKDVVFVGKRKTFARRIETERLTVSSKTISSSKASPPQYSLDLEYLHSANGGKAVLKHGRQTASKGYNAFFDGQGNMLLDTFDQWVESLVTEAIGS